MKLEPVAVSVNCGPPATVEVGVIEVSTGAAFVTVKICAFEVPPPGAAFTTVTDEVPMARTSDARMVAVTDELETKVVDRGEPFQYTVDDPTKFVPETVSVKLLLPAAVEVGVRLVVVGTGFVIVKV